MEVAARGRGTMPEFAYSMISRKFPIQKCRK